MHAPTLLVGAERSGTTLLRLMLDSHPEISFIEEFEYATEIMGDDGSYPDLADYGRHLETSRIFNTSGFEFHRDLPYPELIDGWLRERQTEAGASLAGATIHFGFEKALKIWPEAKLLHIIRDPRDVAPSVIAMGWAGNMWYALDKWLEAEDEWDRVAPTLPDDRKLTVHYLDLISDHVDTLSRICDFMGTDYSERMLDYVDHTDYDLPTPGKVSRWQNKLSDGEVRLAEARVGLDRLRSKGYQPSGLPPLEIGRPRAEWLRWHNRKGKLANRVEALGLWFTVEDLLARASGHEGWKRSVQLRSVEKQKALLKKSWRDTTDGGPNFSAPPSG